MVGSFSKKSFTASSYTTTDYGKFWDPSNLLPWKPRVLIYDHTGTQLLHEYDSFDAGSSQEILVQNITTEYQQGASGTFSLLIDDRNHNIDVKTVGHSCKVVIAICKRQNGDWRNLCSGYVETFEPARDTTTNGLKYTVSGYGSGIIFSETLTNFTKLNTRPILGSANAANYDQYMQVNELARSLVTETDHLDNDNDISIQNRGQFQLDGISDRVRDMMHDFSVKHTQASSVMNSFTDFSGSYWGVDPYDVIYMRYPWEGNTSVTIKTFKSADKDNDDIINTSYFFGPWKWTTYSNLSNGFANVLISIAGTNPKPVIGEVHLEVPTPDSGTPLYNIDICQRFNLTIPDCHHISLLLKKVGVVSEKYLRGHIYTSQYDRVHKCHKPHHRSPIATFKIRVSQIPQDNPHPVFARIHKLVHHMPHADNYWISLHRIGQDAQNTVYWYHDNVPNNDEDPSTGTRPVDPTQPPNLEGLPEFNTSPTLPTYTYATYYGVRTKVIVKDPISCVRFGEVEAFVDLSGFTTDFKTVCNTLMAMLRYTAKPPVIYDTAQVSIPDPPFTPATRVRIIDDTSGLTAETNTIADLLRVRHEFDVQKIESGVGGYLCDVSVQGLYDYLAVEGMPTLPGMPVPEELSYQVFVT